MQRLFAKKDVAKIIHESLHRKTGIICTVGMNNSIEQIGKLVDHGMNIMRINCSHGDHAHHQKSIDNLRQYINNLPKRRVIASMLDIRGPKIRTGLLDCIQVNYEPGETFTIKLVPTDQIPNFRGNKTLIYCDYMSFPKSVTQGSRILIDDGLMELECLGVGEDFITVEVKNKATLFERKGVLIPGAIIDLPAVSAKDKDDIKFAVRNNIDFVAASFIRRAAQVREVKSVLGWEGRQIHIVAKVENQEGLDNIDEIIREADAVMVARGDLGTELPPEKIFSAQKTIITKCNLVGKPVITATQMLESMTMYPSPTRAECTDVANAILDGTDCVMLSGETAKGKYPVQAVQTMHNICKEAEESLDYERIYEYLDHSTQRPLSIKEAYSSSAVHIAYEIKAKLIVVFSETGTTSRYLSKYKPIMPIVALSHNKKLLQLECMNRGVIPHYIKEQDLYRPMIDVIKDVFEHFVTNKYPICTFGRFITRSFEQKNLIICMFKENDENEETQTIKIFQV